MMNLTPSKNNQNGHPPSNRDPAFDTYIKAVMDDIQRSLEKGLRYHPHDNLTRQERKALLLLRSRSDILITPADKDSAMVVMSNTITW